MEDIDQTAGVQADFLITWEVNKCKVPAKMYLPKIFRH